MRKLLKMSAILALTLGLSANAYVENHGEGPYTEEQGVVSESIQTRGASVKNIALGDDMQNACAIFKELLTEHKIPFYQGANSCSTGVMTFGPRSQIEFDKNKKVKRIVLSSNLLGFEMDERYDVIVNAYAKSYERTLYEFFKHKAGVGEQVNGNKVSYYEYVELYNDNNEKITIVDGYFMLETLPKGSF